MLDKHRLIKYYFFMELRVLKYFLAVAQTGSITKAANVLHLTQPTLSRQLMDLELELGHKLFVRGKHSISLTQEGLVLKARAQEIVELADKTYSEFKNDKNSVSGDVYIGGGESESIFHIAEIIREIQQEYPQIKFHMYSGNGEDVVEKLDKGLLDFGVLIQPIDLSKYNSVSLNSKDTWGLILRKDDKLAQKKFVTVKDLENIPLIASRQLSKKYLVQNDFTKWFGEYIDKLNIVATYNLIYNASVMVEAKIGYAIGLDKLVSNKNLCFRPFYPKLESALDVVWKKEQVLTKASRIFLEKLKG